MAANAVTPEQESAEKLPFPDLLDERETAKILRVTPATVRAERIRRRLGYTKIGARIFYTRQQIAEYLKRQAVPACESYPSTIPAKSEYIGSAKSREVIERMDRGAGPGMTSERDRRAVSALAQQTFKKRVSASPRG